VLSALGPRSSADATLLADCAQSTVAAMRRAGVRRLIVISSALLFPNLGPLAAILRLVLRSVLADSRRMEGLVEASSDLEWTIVRPPRLTNGAHTGHYRVAAGELPRGGGAISRSDLANFVLDEAERRNHLRALVGVCN
jgi:putative NADH-flavin reductase